MEQYLEQGVLNHVHNLDFGSLRLVEFGNGRAVIETPTCDNLSNIYHNVHGGSLNAISDMIASAAAYTLGKHVVTLQSSFNFLKGIPCDGKTMRAEAEVIHNGRTTIVVNVAIKNAAGQDCMTSVFTMFVPRAVEPGEQTPFAPLSFDCDGRR